MKTLILGGARAAAVYFGSVKKSTGMKITDWKRESSRKEVVGSALVTGNMEISWIADRDHRTEGLDRQWTRVESGSDFSNLDLVVPHAAD
jgi:hypothetical protein